MDTRPVGRATMQQVAARAGVSLKTVSRVVNSEPGVSARLSQRVNDAVAELGYRHNLAASNLRRGQRTASIGVLVQDVGNMFCSELLRAVEDTARERGVVIMAGSLDESEEREHELVSAFVARRIDGLILMPASKDQSYLRPDIDAGLPVVLIDRRTESTEMDSVSADNVGGSQAMVEHLISYGHRKIAFLGDSHQIATAVQRREGYRRALAAAGIPHRPEYEHLDVRTEADAIDQVGHLLALADPPTAIFTARNVISLGTARALKERGLNDQIAMAGFDDFPAADLLEPAITVMRQDVASLGRCAIDRLLARLDGDTSQTYTDILPPLMVVRGSGEISPAAD